jgi:hypothetical protein
MSRELTIEYIGPSDEDRAHLRLLMRRLGDALATRWRWGDEQHADALFVDPTVLSGQMARARAQEAGMRCVLVDAPPKAPNERGLARPFRAEALRETLDAIAAERSAAAAATPPRADSPFADALPFDLGPADAQVPRVPTPGPSADDAEALFRRPIDPVPLPRLPKLADLEAAGLVEAEPPTARSLHRSARPAAPGDPPPRGTEAGSGTRKAVRLPLLDYLTQPILGGPSRIEVEGLPPLALDPKDHAFHSPAPLAALRPWLRREVAVQDWLPLTGARLRELREQEPARDLLQLRWLAALDAADGSLPRRLDPGGHFSLAAPFEPAPDFPQHRRIAQALAQPIRLHELAALTGVPMGTVFDAVAALDAVGMVACRPRQRLQPPAPAPRNGLLARAVGGLKGIGLLP